MNKYKGSGAKVYLDPCCGWGTRMLASAYIGLDYIGFDINTKLVAKLREFGSLLQKFNPNWKFTIYEQGSQHFVPELVGVADIIMTSPPYFNLEKYDTKYSTDDKTVNSYEQWVKEFLEPLLHNCSQYCKGYTIINIKDFKKFTLEADTIKSAEKVGLTLTVTDNLKNIERISRTGELKSSDERVFCFTSNKKPIILSSNKLDI